MFISGMIVGAVLRHYWPQIKSETAKLRKKIKDSL